MQLCFWTSRKQSQSIFVTTLCTIGQEKIPFRPAFFVLLLLYECVPLRIVLIIDCS